MKPIASLQPGIVRVVLARQIFHQRRMPQLERSEAAFYELGFISFRIIFAKLLHILTIAVNC